MAPTKVSATLYMLLLVAAAVVLVYLIIFFQQGWQSIFVSDVLLVLLFAPVLLVLCLLSFCSLLFAKHPMLTSMPLFASCGIWAMFVLYSITSSLDASATMRRAPAVEAAFEHQLPLNGSFAYVDPQRQSRFDRVYCDAQGHKLCGSFSLNSTVAVLASTPYFANFSSVAAVLDALPAGRTLNDVCDAVRARPSSVPDTLHRLPALCARCEVLTAAVDNQPTVGAWLNSHCPLLPGDSRAAYCAVLKVPGIWSSRLYEHMPHPFQGTCYGVKVAELRREYVEGVGYIAIGALLVTLEIVWLNRGVVLDYVKPPLHRESQSRPSWSEIV
ncbi:hypothetical protein ACHHYP_12022 [Achlya hypogyna]|uniref:Uncharacterized protein n=1 Tax=Achlya hypogyna TaxID=1202772 RepID=A0A1V9YHT1_ACHHY|nr:hypothetical protein ACHHYP_12022 [Achlya hypogyna]